MFTAISAHGFQCKTPCQQATDDDIDNGILGIDHVSRKKPHFCEVETDTNSFLGVSFETLCPDLGPDSTSEYRYDQATQKCLKLGINLNSKRKLRNITKKYIMLSNCFSLCSYRSMLNGSN